MRLGCWRKRTATRGLRLTESVLVTSFLVAPLLEPVLQTLFSSLLLPSSAQIATVVAAQGIVQTFPGPEAARFYGLPDDEVPLDAALLSSLWVDDLATPVLAPAVDVLRKTQAAFKSMWNSFPKYGFSLNMAAGKTEFKVAVNGPKAEVGRRRAAALGNHNLFCCDCGGGNIIPLGMVECYTHMGAKTNASGSVLLAIVARQGAARPIMKRRRVRFFRKTAVATASKMQVAFSVMLSRQLYACRACLVLNAGERQRLQANVMSTYMEVLGEAFENDSHRISDQVLLHVHQVRSPYCVVRFSMLRLSMRAAS